MLSAAAPLRRAEGRELPRERGREEYLGRVRRDEGHDAGGEHRRNDLHLARAGVYGDVPGRAQGVADQEPGAHGEDERGQAAPEALGPQSRDGRGGQKADDVAPPSRPAARRRRPESPRTPAAPAPRAGCTAPAPPRPGAPPASPPRRTPRRSAS